MKFRLFNKSLLLAGAMVAGCATPSAELIEARKQYRIAKTGLANETVPAKVLEAKQALALAEKAHKEDDGSFEERSYAYLASRKALIAIAEGRRARIAQQIADADKEYVGVQKEMLQEARYEAAQIRGDLRDKDRQLGAERQARRQLEESLSETKKQLTVAMLSLKEVAHVKQDKHGTVITLDGSVLFSSGSANLLGSAREKLQRVANVLKNEGSGKRFVVVGHTDDRGARSRNVRLSRQRAESVRQQLINLGVGPAKLSAEGRGQSDPVASNRSAEGRANNRRVEIVVLDN